MSREFKQKARGLRKSLVLSRVFENIGAPPNNNVILAVLCSFEYPFCAIKPALLGLSWHFPESTLIQAFEKSGHSLLRYRCLVLDLCLVGRLPNHGHPNLSSTVG